MLVAVRAAEVSVPDVALAPLQAPVAVQLVALVEDHVKVEEPPFATVIGFAVSVSVGTGGTVTVTDRLIVPPAPVQFRLNVLVLASAPVDWLPDVALVPDQAPEAVHEVAFADDQVSVEDTLAFTVAGLALNESVGAGFVTSIVTELFALPLAPVQVREKVPAVESAGVVSVPDVGLDPDQAPEATQEVALVDDQVNTDEVPVLTVAGLALMETVGVGGGGVVPATVTPVVRETLPPRPVHVKEKLLVVVSGPVDSLPEFAFAPDQLPEATHAVAFAEDQLMTETPPELTLAGFAPSVSAGVGTGTGVGTEAGGLPALANSV